MQDRNIFGVQCIQSSVEAQKQDYLYMGVLPKEIPQGQDGS